MQRDGKRSEMAAPMNSIFLRVVFQGPTLDILKITYREILRIFQARQEDIDRLWQANAHRIVKFAKICEMFENIIMIKFDTRSNFERRCFREWIRRFRNNSTRPPKVGRNLPEIETITVKLQMNPLKLVRFSKFEESIKSPVIVLKDWSTIRIGVLWHHVILIREGRFRSNRCEGNSVRMRRNTQV